MSAITTIQGYEIKDAKSLRLPHPDSFIRSDIQSLNNKRLTNNTLLTGTATQVDIHLNGYSLIIVYNSSYKDILFTLRVDDDSENKQALVINNTRSNFDFDVLYYSELSFYYNFSDAIMIQFINGCWIVSNVYYGEV